MECKICQGMVREIFKAQVLGKHPVSYFQCDNCAFIQTEQPYWLEEAYQNAYSVLDTGLLQRNLDLRDKLEGIIYKSFDPRGLFLDYAGGYGIFCRLMRDKGLDFYTCDKFCKNIFAEYFDIGNDPDNIKKSYELITAIELFEHLENPLSEIEKLFCLTGTIFFTTELIPEDLKDLKGWWYIAAESGQHISFYSRKSLQIIASRFDAKVYSEGFCHILTVRRIKDPFLSSGNFLLNLIARICRRVAALCENKHFKANPSLTWQDHEHIKAILNKNG